MRGTCVAQSPYNRSQGVRDLTSSKFPRLLPLAPDLWTTNTIAVTVTHKKTHASVAVVAHYSTPGNRPELDAELKNVIARIRYGAPSLKLIVAGDFNRSLQWMEKLAAKLDLHLCQNQDQQLVTHINTAHPENNNQLDYTLTNLDWSNTRTNEAWTHSDHRIL